MKHLLTDEHIEVLFDTAVDLGTKHWCTVSIEDNIDAELYDFNEEGWELTVLDRKTMLKTKLTKQNFYLGWEKLKSMYPTMSFDILNKGVWKEDADTWFQLCVFGEVIYD
jgi:hypothetical protein